MPSDKAHQPIDQTQRERALDIRCSFAVSAPAGSGKTGLLTQRVLALLARCDEPENLLAITFTRKAAAEMQERILNALHNAASQPEEPEAEYEKATWHLAQAVLQRNEERQWQLFNCPNRLRIVTIDGLCRSISQQMPFESQLGNTPEILDDASIAYCMAARETLKMMDRPEGIQSDLIRLVKHFDNRLDKIEQLFVQLLAKRDQWLGIIFQTKNQRQLLESMLVEVIEEHLIHARELLAPIGSELAMLADHAANNLCHIIQTNHSPIEPCLGLTELPLAKVEAIPQWLGLTELLLTQKGEMRKSATKGIGFLAPSDKSLSKEQQAVAKVDKQRFAELLEQSHSLAGLESTLHQIRSLPSPCYEEKQWQLLDSLTNILFYLEANLRITFQQLGKADYLTVTLAALEALGNNDTPTDLALALDYKIQHILVDEFQDTSTTQLELLQRLTAGWQPNDGRTLFIVGDAMQSCYRFRDANVGIFLDIREHGLGDIELENIDLSVNFRSQKNIVDWVNNSFKHIFPQKNDSNRGAVSYNPSASFNGALEAPAVTSHILSYQDKVFSRHSEADTIVELIQRARTLDPCGSIAILVRSKSHAKHIFLALSHASIDYQATDIDRLNTNMPVLDVLSLTKALLYPNDRMAWLAILRAPWCGIDMSDITALVNYGKKQKHWPLIYKNLLNDNAITELSHAAQKKIKRFINIIKPAIEQQKRQSLRYWIQGIWLDLGGPGLLSNSFDSENINTFFGLLDKHEQHGTIVQWQQLEQAINQLYAKPKDIATKSTTELAPYPAVQVMTIHKSKGLEFDTVIIPSLDRIAPNNDKELMTWLERIGYSNHSHQQERQLLISPVNAIGDDDDAIYKFIRQQNQEKDQLESTRVLYVGCTRAIKHLHLLGYAAIDNTENITSENTIHSHQLKQPQKNSLLYTLWENIKNDCHIISTTYKKPVNTEKKRAYQKITHPNYILSLNENWQAPLLLANNLLEKYRGDNTLATLSDNIAKPDALIQREQRYIGSLIHLVLQHIATLGLHTWQQHERTTLQQRWNIQLRQLGLTNNKLDQAIDTIQQAIDNTLKDPIGRWIVDHHHEASAAELELWNNAGQHIIDRTFISHTSPKQVLGKNRLEITEHDKKTRWIIDYKSSKPAQDQNFSHFINAEVEHYKAQLQRYRALFSHEDVEIASALYFPLLAHFEIIE